MTGKYHQILFTGFLLIFFVVFFYFKLHKYFTFENADIVKNWFIQLSYFGVLVIFLLFISFNLAMLPTFYFIFISGYLYGFINGSLVAWAGMTLGLLASFINVRFLFRDTFSHKFGSNKMVMQLESYTEKYHGFAVLFFRLFFLFPYNVQNVAYGLTRLKTSVYVAASAIGILPCTLLYVWIGDAISKHNMKIDNMKSLYWYLGIFFVLLIVFAVIGLFIRKKLYQQVDNDIR